MRRHESSSHVPAGELEMVAAGSRHCRVARRFSFNPADPGVTSEFEYVQRDVDGDTLMLGTGERVRLIGVNTPETNHPQKPVEAFGKEATVASVHRCCCSGSA
jgi:endonuclease YncB( thermonuclease family)